MKGFRKLGNSGAVNVVRDMQLPDAIFRYVKSLTGISA